MTTKVANFNLTADLSPVILWQYQEAERLRGIVDGQEKFLNTAIAAFWQDFNRDFLNIRTCGEHGLALWGRILRTARPVYTDESGNMQTFSDDQYRLVLQARIYLLTFDGSVRALNEFFKLLFPDLTVQIIDNYDMTVQILIDGELPDMYKVLFEKPFVDTFLPRPTGVQYIVGDKAEIKDVFGFDTGTDDDAITGFDQGNFAY